MSFWAMRYGTVFRNIQHKTIDLMTEHENVRRSIMTYVCFKKQPKIFKK